MSGLISSPGMLVLVLIYLSIGGLTVRFSLELALRWVSPARPRTRWAMALAAFALAIVVPLVVLAMNLASTPETVGVAARSEPGPEAGLLQVAPVGEATAWLTWLAVGWPAWTVGIVWLAGCLVLAARGAVSAFRLRRLAKGWHDAPAELRHLLDWPEGFSLRVAERGTPLALGARGGTAFLPLWMLRELDLPAVRSIAEHELAHLRWRDPLIDTAVRSLRSLLWPSLPLWSLERRIRCEREAAADREAIAPPESVEALVYAEALASVAARRLEWSPAIGASGDFEERVRRLLRPGRPGGTARVVTAGLLLVVGTVAVALLPLPIWRQAASDERAGWGPLDHLLGYNPVIRATVTPEERRVVIQGHELTPRETERWFSLLSLEESAEIVREAEEWARAANQASGAQSRDGP